MKYLPTDVSSFTLMMTGNYVYVDKTEHIYDLFSGGTRYYFLSRPRRFGKSLLISTLNELFLGNKELFKDLWIGTSDYNWQQYPVVKIDFSIIGHRNPEDLEANLSWALEKIAKQYNVDQLKGPSLGSRFAELIEKLAKTNKVVLLIDEYDKPILDHINNIEMAEAIRERLKEFYDALKGLDDYLRAIFITGVTKFTKTSLFSGINHLNDISNTGPEATLLGYTQLELEVNFQPYIKTIATQQELAYDDTLKLLKKWYNGYRFSKKTSKVYNPFSILYCLRRGEFENYWFESGTPTFLIHLLRKQPASIEKLTTSNISVSDLSPFDISSIPLIPLLFQTGYITIKEYDADNKRYRLGFPNHEVEASFEKFLVTVLTYQHQADAQDYVFHMRDALDSNDLDSFFEYLKSLFAQIPYHLHIKQEKYYHSLFQLICAMLGMDVQSEVATDKGRIDMIIITKKYIYLFEFKFNTSPQKALDQINTKQYAQKYRSSKKTLMVVGVSFNRNPPIELQKTNKVMKEITAKPDSDLEFDYLIGKLN